MPLTQFKLDSPGTAHPSTVYATNPDAGPRIDRWRMSNGASDGVEVVALDNGRLSVHVLPTRGMGIQYASDRSTAPETRVEWKSPVEGPVHPKFVNIESRNGLGWLDGFSELVCRCGLSSNGPPGNDDGARSPIESALTLHGRIANTPARDVVASVDQDRERLAVSGVVDECTLFGPQLRLRTTISTGFNSLEFTMEDEIENLGSKPAEVQLLYHINIGKPFLNAGSTLAIAAEEIAPRDPRAAEGVDTIHQFMGPTPGYTEEGFFFKPRPDRDGCSTAVLQDATKSLGLAIRFDQKSLPYFVLWKCTQPESDGYVAGLEPATNLPNFKAYERKQGRVINLAPGEKYRTSVSIGVLRGEELRGALAKVQRLQGDQPPVIHRTPQPGWSPAGESK
jgi:galactose mutarotase-like enzyme